MDDKAKAAKIAKLRKQAEDKTVPQDIRNQFLDNANKLELEMGKKANPGMFAKGGAVAKAPAKKPAMKKAPALAVMIAVGKPKAKMAKGGAVAKKGGK